MIFILRVFHREMLTRALQDIALIKIIVINARLSAPEVLANALEEDLRGRSYQTIPNAYRVEQKDGCRAVDKNSR